MTIAKPRANPPDRRDTRRVGISMRAFVSRREGAKGISCLVCDASKLCCRIISSKVADPPDVIYLKVDSIGKELKARIVWRRDGMAGVKFLWDAAQGLSPCSRRAGASCRRSCRPA